METRPKNYENGRCCVFQPFDRGDFDERFDDIIAPAIERALMEPYRVDRDLQAVIPIDTLHSEIQSAIICVADITNRNPNVMYELGYAIAAGKDVVIISGPTTEKYPFDIQHRGIISYHTGSISDFEQLGSALTAKLVALLQRQEKTDKVLSSSPVRKSHGLEPHELTALALVLANTDATDDSVSASTLKESMRKAQYTETGTRLALSRLTQLGYVKANREEGDWNNSFYFTYSLTPSGEGWLLENQDKLELSVRKSTYVPQYEDSEITDADIPF
jgi:hypothetical protein